MKKKSLARGYFLLFVLIAASVLLFLLAELVDTIAVEKNAEILGGDQEKALFSADAGIDYEKWHLAHFPGDLSGNGVIQNVVDPETGSTTGAFSLSISGNSFCGTLSSVRVDSTGWATTTPAHAKTVSVLLSKSNLSASTTPALSNPTRVAADLSTLKTYAQASGVYLSGATYGYKIVFNSNGTFDASPVTAVEKVWGFSNEDGWVQENSVIASTGSSTHYSIPGSCPVVFVGGNAWIEGVISGAVTLGASTTTPADIFLTNNITYAHAEGDGFTAVAQHSVLISPQSPDVMQLYGVYVSGSGHTGRNRYDSSGTHAAPADVQPYITRSTLTTYGTLASDGAVVTKWLSGGAFVSGYSSENDSHDGILAENPPPFTPETADSFGILDWRLKY